MREYAPHATWKEMREFEHFVQFYETDEFLLNSLSDFLSAGLSAGEACVVVAAKASREGVEERLQSGGLDVAAARACGQYIALDAADTLAQFMVDGSPQPERFAEVIGNIITQAAQERPRVRVFGEMVALLWAERNYDAVIRLEELWNDLQKIHDFSLYCAYPMNGCGGTTLAEPLSHVCARHSRVIPAESYTALSEPDDRLRVIIELQQKALSLESEIAERQQVEVALRAVKEELEVQVEDLRRLHEMSLSLTSTLDMEAVLQQVLQAALDVQGTDMGLLSLADAPGNGLQLEVQRGFDEAFLEVVRQVPTGKGACGACYQQQRRIVVADIETDPIFEPYREAARQAGFRACYSTPLVTLRGHIVGVLSVHFRHPHRPSERQTQIMDLYARMAADVIENARLHRQMQQELDERQQLLTREQMARAEAESANRLKDEFLATVSHELRTPLNAIIGWAHVLRSGGIDEATATRAVEIIERNARSQAQLIEDILDVSRVITGKLRLHIKPVDMATIINAAIDSVQLAADAKSIPLEVTLDPAARHVSGDPGRLQQVIWNLLSNAIKFTPAGGRVAVRLEGVGSEAQIKISDTGQGINRDFLPFIFDRFRQADGTSTRRHGGLGLGLAIVRHLVELHGGTVHADSPGEGGGATFILRLPLETTHFTKAHGRARSSRPDRSDISPDTSNAQPDNMAHTLPSALAVPASPTLDNLQILLVDDDAETRQVLSVLLLERQAKVQEAASAAEALDILQWYKPDVIVSDLAMAGEDGYSLIAKIRAAESAHDRRTPAVALTAYVRIEDRARALSAGFNMFVPKPVEPNELLATISHLAEANLTEANLAEPQASSYQV